MSSTQGPPMICATKIMRQHGTRIGSIGGVTFSRTIALSTLVAVIAGALLGLLAAGIAGGGMQGYLYGAIFGGFLGWFAVNYSPLQNESLLTWLALQVNATRRGRFIDGERVTLAVGTAVLPELPKGQVVLARASVRVPAGQYDERGVFINPANRNVPAGRAEALVGATTAGESALTLGGGRSLSKKRTPTLPRRPRHEPVPAAPVVNSDDPFTGPPRKLKD